MLHFKRFITLWALICLSAHFLPLAFSSPFDEFGGDIRQLREGALGDFAFSVYYSSHNPWGDELLYNHGYDNFRAFGFVLDSEGYSYVIGAEEWRNSDYYYFTSFVAKFSPEGDLIFNLLLGNRNKNTLLQGIQLDSQGLIWVAGTTSDPYFFEHNAWKGLAENNATNVLIACISSEGKLLKTALWGGSGNETGIRFLMDQNDNLIISGSTSSPDLPLQNATLSQLGPKGTCFIASMSPEGDLNFSTYWTGNEGFSLRGMAVDLENAVIIGGSTYSTDLPVKNAHTSAFKGCNMAYLARILPNGSLGFCTYLGGFGQDGINSVRVNKNNNHIIVSGRSTSPDFPIKADPEDLLKMDRGFSIPNFVAHFSAEGKLLYSNFINTRGVFGLTVDNQGNIGFLSSHTQWYEKSFFKKNTALTEQRTYTVHFFHQSHYPLYTALIAEFWESSIEVSTKFNAYWLFGIAEGYIHGTKRTVFHLSRTQLPPALAKPNKLLLQIGEEKATLMEHGKVTLLPPLEAPPMIVQGRTLIPLRVLAETMGMDVSWVPDGQYIWLDRDGVRLELQIGRDYAWKYALDDPEQREKLAMDVPPMIANQRTLFPLRFVAENFGALVDWNGFEQRILVSWE